MTNYERAIDLLRTAKSVQHWNELRSVTKAILTTDEMNLIDASGLIVKVLGPDKYIQYNQ